MKKFILSILLLFIFSFSIFFVGALFKQFGALDGPGTIKGKALPVEVLKDKASKKNLVKDKLSISDEKQILFGDLHVHTTYSTDAFMWSLPFLNGKGASPIADACDFA